MRPIVTGHSVARPPQLYWGGGIQSLETGERVDMAASPEVWCVGYEAPGQLGGFASCPDEAFADRLARCEACHERTALDPCLRCTGHRCRNPARRDDCLPAQHFVYLACYDHDTVKVGVTQSGRLRSRMLEQGALGGLAIALAGGQVAREIEHAIGDAGWRDRIKLPGVIASPFPDRVAGLALLREHRHQVARRVGGFEVLERGVFEWVADAYPPPPQIAPRLLDPARDPIAGVVEGVRGNLLLLRCDPPADQPEHPGELVAVNLRSLHGREVHPTVGAATGPLQTALLF